MPAVYNVVYVVPKDCSSALAEQVKALPLVAEGEEVCGACMRLGIAAELYAGGRVPRMFVYPSGEWRPANRYEMMAGAFMR